MMWFFAAYMVLSGIGTVGAAVEIDRSRNRGDSSAERQWRIVSAGFALCFGAFGLLLSGVA
jgi:hypothetical protein